MSESQSLPDIKQTVVDGFETLRDEHGIEWATSKRLATHTGLSPYAIGRALGELADDGTVEPFNSNPQASSGTWRLADGAGDGHE